MNYIKTIKSSVKNKYDFPVLQFVLAVLIDIADFAFPIGYIIGVVGEIYLYNWAVDYLRIGELNDDTKNTVTKIKNKTIERHSKPKTKTIRDVPM